MGTPSLVVPRDPQPCIQLSGGSRLHAVLGLQQSQPPRMASASCGNATSQALGFLWEKDVELCPSFLSRGRRWEPALLPSPCPPLWSCSRPVWPCRQISGCRRMQHPPNWAPHAPSPGRSADSPNNRAAADKTLQPRVPFPVHAHCGPSINLVLGDGWGLEELSWGCQEPGACQDLGQCLCSASLTSSEDDPHKTSSSCLVDNKMFGVFFLFYN